MRKSWVKSLRELALSIEKTHPASVTSTEKSFLEKFSLISRAYADARFNCFYGGWPSSLKSGKCQHPKESNPDYRENSSCSAGQFQCQPLLFGKNVCVQSTTQKLTQSCEDQFKAKGGSLDHLKGLTYKEQDQLREISLLAREICTTKNIQGGVSACTIIKEKFESGMKSLERTESDVGSSGKSMAEIAQSLGKTHPEDCVEPEHEHQRLAQEVRALTAALSPAEKLYEDLKSEFQRSPMCDPYKIINDPGTKPNPIIMGKLIDDLRNLQHIRTNKKLPAKAISELAQKYRLSESAQAEVTPILTTWLSQNGHDEASRTSMGRVRGLLLQDFIKNYKFDPEFLREELEQELVDKNIFVKNSEGNVECPFVSKDAFLKAYQGHQEVLKKHGKSLSKKNQLTIVDYTRPSNERRMFTIDLGARVVAHNTWVAHGAGDGSQSGGVDGLGSAPKMSNVPGSKLSSDGFIIATAASHGNTFGPNVLLRGVDRANTNLGARAVIVHKWNSPYASYAVGTEDYNFETESYGPTYDVIDRVKQTDFRNGDMRTVEKAFYSLNSATNTDKRVSATEGCLGVPLINIKHLDRRGRNLSQLEALRQDLPGSVVFNYSGPSMQSNYLK